MVADQVFIGVLPTPYTIAYTTLFVFSLWSGVTSSTSIPSLYMCTRANHHFNESTPNHSDARWTKISGVLFELIIERSRLSSEKCATSRSSMLLKSTVYFMWSGNGLSRGNCTGSNQSVSWSALYCLSNVNIYLFRIFTWCKKCLLIECTLFWWVFGKWEGELVFVFSLDVFSLPTIKLSLTTPRLMDCFGNAWIFCTKESFRLSTKHDL